MTADSNSADVLIAGGGIAGAALATMLGRRGFRVELFERAQFPREKPCGEGLMPAGVAVLDRLGLMEAAGGAPFLGVRYHLGDCIAQGRFPEASGVPVVGRGLRRKHLDHVLFQAAAATPGVSAHTGTRVDAPLCENGRVVGLIVEGESRRAQLVVGADGVHSRIRHRLGLDVRPRRKRVGLRAHFRLAAGQVHPAWVDVYVCRGYELYVTPLPDDELLIAALVDAESLAGPIEPTFHRWCRSQPSLAEELEGAEPISSILAISPLAGCARRGVARGVVLLGDAAGFLDPITGGGMTQALMTAELLTEWISCHWGGSEEWTWQFDRARKAMLRDYSLLTAAVLWLSGHPRLAARLLPSLQARPTLLSHLVGVSGGVRRLFEWPHGEVSPPESLVKEPTPRPGGSPGTLRLGS